MNNVSFKESGFGDSSYKEQTWKEIHNVNLSIENGISQNSEIKLE